MDYTRMNIEAREHIALVAHDNNKQQSIEWTTFNRALLAEHVVYATGTTGMMLEQGLGLGIETLESRPLGGDRQIGAKISRNEIDVVIFFWDPLNTLLHDSDRRALLRIAVVWNIPVACNRAIADFLISSPLMSEEYDRLVRSYTDYPTRIPRGQRSPRVNSAFPSENWTTGATRNSSAQRAKSLSVRRTRSGERQRNLRRNTTSGGHNVACDH